jgi:hypothetical protein
MAKHVPVEAPIAHQTEINFAPVEKAAFAATKFLVRVTFSSTKVTFLSVIFFVTLWFP